MFNSWFFRVVLIPSSVFLSVVFGGSYGTGREIMEFVSRFGPKSGLLGISMILLTYAVLLFVTFELARLFKAYEYRGFFKVLLGRGWFLYEFVILVGMVITLAVCATAAGAVLNSHFDQPKWLGSLLLLAIVFLLNYQGRAIVEKTMIAAVVALMLVLLGLVYQLAGDGADAIREAFAADSLDPGTWSGGVQYALVNGGFIPLLLYCSRGIESRPQALIAGCCAACVAVIPAIVFHVAFMSAYPEVTEKELPTYWLIEQLAAPWFLNAYALVLFVLIAQTGVGMLQGFLERLDAWQLQTKGAPLTSIGHGLVGIGMVAGSMLLGSVGIIALIAAGYNILAVSFILVFAVPLLTRGVWLMFVGGNTG
ncbi:MAG: hypothetical protein ACR2P1_02090 [Pseudomonadales bacterium]